MPSLLQRDYLQDSAAAPFNRFNRFSFHAHFTDRLPYIGQGEQ
jgi:hypothetical protein